MVEKNPEKWDINENKGYQSKFIMKPKTRHCKPLWGKRKWLYREKPKPGITTLIRPNKLISSWQSKRRHYKLKWVR